MRVAIRSTAVVLTAFFAAVVLAITTAVTSAMAATALMVGGIAAGTLPDLVMSNVLGGRYAGYNRVNVVWPAQARPYTGPNDKTLGQSVREGADALEYQIRTRIMNDDVTVVGMSAGALVTDEVLRRLVANPLPAGARTLTIVVVADSSRQDVINESRYNPVYDYTYQPPPATPYHVTVVTGEYDGAADFPDRPWNVLAVVNAMVGAIYVHVPVMFASLDGLSSTETRNALGGVTRHYLVPTKTLPLVQLMPFLAPIEGVLKGIVDSGYSRNDARAATLSNISARTAAPESAVSFLASDSTASSSREPGEIQTANPQRLTGVGEAPAEETNRSVTGTVDALAHENEVDLATAIDDGLGFAHQPDEGLDPDTERFSNGATDLTDGNQVKPLTFAGEKESVSNALDTPTYQQSSAFEDIESASLTETLTNGPSEAEDDDLAATEDNDQSDTNDDNTE